MADFPTSKTSYTAPTTSDDVDPSWIIELQVEIEALQDKVGIDDSTDEDSVDYKLKSRVVEKTSDYQLLAKDMRGNSTFVNDNDDRAYTLVNPAVVGFDAEFECKYDEKYIRVNAGGSQKLNVRDQNGLWTSSAGGYVRTNEEGVRFRVQCVKAGFYSVILAPGQNLKGDE